MVPEGHNSRKVAREILENTRQRVSDEAVRRERHRQGLKSFHVIAKLLTTNMRIEDRKWLAKCCTRYFINR